jgi:hypothetical protein
MLSDVDERIEKVPRYVCEPPNCSPKMTRDVSRPTSPSCRSYCVDAIVVVEIALNHSTG